MSADTNKSTEEVAIDPVALKKARFEKDPDDFIHVDDIVMAVIRGENSLGTIHGAAKRFEMEQALSRLQYKTFQIFMGMDAENMARAMKEKKSDIVVVGEHNGAPLHRIQR